MLASLALMSLLQAPTVGAGNLTIANVHPTYGMLGPVRPDSKVRPGDILSLSFDIQGISTDATGKASYSIGVDIMDSAGKVLFKQPPRKSEEFLPLGGDSFPAVSHFDLAADAPAGEYTMKVTVADAANAKSTSVSVKFEVLPKGFDLVRFNVTGDSDGLVPVGAYSVGQPFWLHGAAVGFQRSAQGAKQPKVSFQLRVLDETGAATTVKPFTGTVDKDVPASATTLPVRYFLSLNRAGKYTVEVVATDDLTSKSVTKKFPITVISTK
jgi:hypothetical protein